MAHRSAPTPVNAFALFSLSLILALFPFASAHGQTEPSVPTPAVHAMEPIPFPRNAHPTPPPAEVTAALETFFNGIMKAEVRPSFDTLLANSRLAGRTDNVNTLIDKTQQALSLYGKMIDYELYDTRQIGTRTVVVTYLTSLQVQPLRWRFIFYHADKSWTLINLRVDDSMEDLLE